MINVNRKWQHKDLGEELLSLEHLGGVEVSEIEVV